MTERTWLDAYLEAWRTGDAGRSLAATAPGFYYDDPDTGRVTRDGFVAFFDAFLAAGTDMAGGRQPAPFLIYNDMVIAEGAPSTAWCWWLVNGTAFRGAACIRFDQTGVLSERIAYFTRDPQETPLPEG